MLTKIILELSVRTCVFGTKTIYHAVPRTSTVAGLGTTHIRGERVARFVKHDHGEVDQDGQAHLLPTELRRGA